jgi:hypothetical protein
MDLLGFRRSLDHGDVDVVVYDRAWIERRV